MPKLNKEQAGLKERMERAKNKLPDRAVNIYFHLYPPETESDRTKVYQVWNSRTTDQVITERFEAISEGIESLMLKMIN